MAQMQESLVRSGVAIPLLLRRKANMEAVYQQLLVVEGMHKAQAQIEELIGDRRYADAIDLLGKQREWLVRVCVVFCLFFLCCFSTSSLFVCASPDGTFIEGRGLLFGGNISCYADAGIFERASGDRVSGLRFICGL